MDRPRILIVDDEQTVRDLVAKTLSMADYDVDTAPDGPSALDRLNTTEYDLLITDLKMPGMDGLSVIREVRRRSSRAADRHHHRLFDRGERHRGHQPRRLRLSHQAVPPAPRAGRRRARARRAGAFARAVTSQKRPRILRGLFACP